MSALRQMQDELLRAANIARSEGSDVLANLLMKLVLSSEQHFAHARAATLREAANIVDQSDRFGIADRLSAHLRDLADAIERSSA